MIRLVLGVIFIVVGGVWIAQGTGALGGSFMSGEAVWAVIGVIVALVGVALVVGSLRDRRRADGER
jgi:hypothetical protein